jgi:hypothetical protein
MAIKPENIQDTFHIQDTDVKKKEKCNTSCKSIPYSVSNQCAKEKIS